MKAYTKTNKMKTYIQRKRFKLPKFIKDEWFAKVIHIKEEKYPPAFDEDGAFIDYKIGDVVPIKELANGKLAYYKIIDSHYRHGDWLYGSDGYRYNLKFHHIGDKL